MEATARFVPPVQEPIKGSLDFALAEIAKSLSGGIVAEIKKHARLSATVEALNRLLTEDMLPMLEKAFFQGFLARDDEKTRQQRAVLMHLLSAAALQRLNLGDISFGDSPSEEEIVTSEEAAKMLHVSRTHVNALADAGKLEPVSVTSGGHRRFAKATILTYKAQSKLRQASGLAAMMEASQRFGLYDNELEGVRRKVKR